MAIITGTAGSDHLKGTSGDDDFHLEQGGADAAFGKAGDDVFHMGAAFTGADSIDGGGGRDVVELDGDYSAGVVFAATSMINVETLSLIGGHSYVLSGLSDANAPQNVTRLTIDASDLGAGDSLHLDASGMTRGVYVVGGAGGDLITGGAGDDLIDAGGGRNTILGGAGDDNITLGAKVDKAKGGDGNDTFVENDINAATARDKIDGGAGVDSVRYAGDGTLVLTDKSLHSIEQLFLQSHLDITMADGNVAAGQTLTVDGQTAQTLRFDGSLESDGQFDVQGATFGDNTLIGGAGGDSLIGGGQADLLDGGAGDDVISARGGADTITGGLGQDVLSGQAGGEADTFVYLSTADSTVDHADRIDVLKDGVDVIDLHAIDADTTLGGEQSFNLVSHFTGQAGQLVVSYDSARDVTDITADVDGDGEADMLIVVAGDHSSFTNFAL